MGATLTQGATEFAIKAEDFSAALTAIKAMQPKEHYRFAWIDPQEIQQATTLEAALTAWGWEPVVEDGDIVDIEFTWEKSGDEDALFKAIAPFVTDGSYIEADCEGEYFRWYFEDRKCYMQLGSITYAPGTAL